MPFGSGRPVALFFNVSPVSSLVGRNLLYCHDHGCFECLREY